MIRRLLAPLAVLAIALSACSAGTPTSPAGPFTEYAVGDRKSVPVVSGELLNGGSLDLATLRGKVVVLNFWASWCAPCRAEAADLEEVYQATKASGVEFVGVDIRDERDKGLAFLAGRSSYPSIFDPAGRIALNFVDVPPSAIPATLIIDREGRIAALSLLPLRSSDLRPVVERIAAEPAHG